MTTDIAKTKAAAGLATLASLRTGLAQVVAQIPASIGGQSFLRLLKDGNWVVGADDTPIASGTQAVINIESVLSGYSCWTNRQPGQGKNENLGDEMWAIGSAVPPVHTMPEHHDPRTQELCKWKPQMACDIKLLEGTLSGQQVMYKVTSVGGVRALTAVIQAAMAQLDAGSEYVYPIIELSSDSYQHASYGRTYVPMLEIVGWMNADGEEGDADDADGAPVAADKKIAPAPEPAPEPEAAPAGRRRRV